MSTELFRNYLDIINENSQANQQLDEGMLDSIKAKIGQVAQKMFSKEEMLQMKNAVEQATGKPIQQVSIRDISGNTAMKIAQSLGASGQVNESEFSELARKIFSVGSSLAGITGIVASLFGGIPVWAGVISLIAMFAGSLVGMVGTRPGRSELEVDDDDY